MVGKQTRFRRRAMTVVVVLLALLLACSPAIQAVTHALYTDDELFAKAVDAYTASDWLTAALFFMAYIERDPQTMRYDARHADFVRGALDGCLVNLKREKENTTAEMEYWRRAEATTANECLAKCPDVDLTENVDAGLGKPEVVLLPLVPPALPRSYPLICRGAEDLRFTFQAMSSVSSKPHVMIDFDIVGANLVNTLENVGEVGAGQCKWIAVWEGQFPAGMLVFADPVLPPDRFAIEWSGGSVQWVTGADWLKRLYEDKEAIEAFHAYDDGQGHVMVTKRGLAAGLNRVASSSTYDMAQEGLAGLRKEGPVYTDRNYVFDSVPEFLQGATYLLTANADRLSSDPGFLALWANRATRVYVAHDVRYTALPAWLKDFKELDESLSFWDGRETVKLRLYEKWFAPGAIALGGNVSEGETAKYGMYSVVLTPAD